MIHLSVTRQADGSVLLLSADAWFLLLLHEIPELLSEEPGEAARERLYPQPSGDEEMQEDWERLVHPDLFALVASAAEIVRKDLRENLRATEAGTEVVVAEKHIAAWISALNVARHLLAEGRGLVEGRHLNPPSDDDDAAALVKMDLLAYLQSELIDLTHPTPEGPWDQAPPEPEEP